MTVSNSTDFTVNETDIIEGAYANINLLSQGMAVSGMMYSRARHKLNLIVKTWMGQADFAPGLKTWTRQAATLFLEYGKYEYTLGSGGDHATSSYVSTTVKVAGVITDTTIDVSSTTGIATGYYIGILMDDGTAHWTTVNGAPAGDTVTLTDALDAGAAVGNTVYVYASKVHMPLDIMTAMLKDSNGNETPLGRFKNYQAYEMLGDKDAEGTPTTFFYEAKLTTGTFFLDTAVNDVSDIIDFIYYRPVYDLDTTVDTIDFPQQWYLPLELELSVQLAPVFGRGSKIPELKELRNEALITARNYYPETVDVVYEPDRE